MTRRNGKTLHFTIAFVLTVALAACTRPASETGTDETGAGAEQDRPRTTRPVTQPPPELIDQREALPTPARNERRVAEGAANRTETAHIGH